MFKIKHAVIGWLLMTVAANVIAQELDYAKRAGGTFRDSGRGIAVDAAGNSVVTGDFEGSATFGVGEPNETVLTSAGNNAIFVAKFASDGSLVWTTQAGGANGNEGGQGIAVDVVGNSVVTGRFSGISTFGAGEPNETVLTSSGLYTSSNIFVAKYAPDGSLIWAKQSGGTNSAEGSGIALDGTGNSVVTGYFSGGSATFGAGEPNETVLTSAGNAPNIFVAKYASDGSLVWATQAGGTKWDFGQGIAVDAEGNSVVIGHFWSSATFGAGEPNETVLTSIGSDIFVAKYEPDGSLVWATQADGTDFTDGRGIALDATGNSVLIGFFGGSATFGAGEPNETVLNSAGERDMFVAKYTPDGALVWTTQAGGTKWDVGFGIAVDAADNCVVTGWFNGIATFGAGEHNETELTSAGGQDIFVAKFKGVDRPGDVNKNGCVDRTDANIVLNNVRAGSDDPDYDINQDGVVNRADGRAVVRLFDNPDGAPCQ